MTPREIADWHEKEAAIIDTSTHRRVMHAQAAATIRAQAEALKIATEALDKIGYSAEARTGYLLSECVGIARSALARIRRCE